jgi:hypothetical protein
MKTAPTFLLLLFLCQKAVLATGYEVDFEHHGTSCIN